MLILNMTTSYVPKPQNEFIPSKKELISFQSDLMKHANFFKNGFLIWAFCLYAYRQYV